MASPIIKLENVKRTYHVGDVDVHALRDVTLTVNAGEFVAIMGSSGSGKSTLMAIIGCLDRPSSGRYFFEGVDVADMVSPLDVLQPDDRTSHDGSVGALRLSKPWPRHAALGGIPLFGDNDAVIWLQIALDDLDQDVVI